MLLQNPVRRFDEFYNIYESSFPPVERRTKEGQKEAMQSPYYRVRVKEDWGEILAFVGYWDLPGCLFIEHLATTEKCRGKGYGKDLVKECLEETGKPVFLEIEPVTDKDPMTGRRAGFYERLDFYINRFPYLQMPLKPGDQAVPLWVMSFGAPISDQEFTPYKKEIHEIVYKVTEN